MDCLMGFAGSYNFSFVLVKGLLSDCRASSSAGDGKTKK